MSGPLFPCAPPGARRNPRVARCPHSPLAYDRPGCQKDLSLAPHWRPPATVMTGFRQYLPCPCRYLRTARHCPTHPPCSHVVQPMAGSRSAAARWARGRRRRRRSMQAGRPRRRAGVTTYVTFRRLMDLSLFTDRDPGAPAAGGIGIQARLAPVGLEFRRACRRWDWNSGAPRRAYSERNFHVSMDLHRHALSTQTFKIFQNSLI